ncbi:MAG: NUDIX domain-containing protein [Anaerolineae bacterium]
MAIGRFQGGVGALIWSPDKAAYLLLRRSEAKDFAPGVWECVTGRVDQGEGFEDAVRREVREELGVEVEIDFVLGTTHFYRGAKVAENELIGIVYHCSLADADAVVLSQEHSELRWVTHDEATAMLSDASVSESWLGRVLERAVRVRRLLPPAFLALNHCTGFELG